MVHGRIYGHRGNPLSSDPENALYEALGILCEHFVQTPAHHADRLTLLACPESEWMVVRDIIDPRSTVAEQLEAIERGQITLYAHHSKTPTIAGLWSASMPMVSTLS